ncbi:hypothetical protein [Henriciella sp.]|uniref:hypothetical protein n=1 Tax=Henriciella sp. TaxID=1968823 RepID=UPI0026317AA2|nr:hypothetical protein [Henriciella sp.]
MYDDETLDIYLRDADRKIIKGRIDFEPYARLYHLLYLKPELETLIADKLRATARIYESDPVEYVDDVTQLVAAENNIEIPVIPEGSMTAEQWAIAWNKIREREWQKQQGSRA